MKKKKRTLLQSSFLSAANAIFTKKKTYSNQFQAMEDKNMHYTKMLQAINSANFHKCPLNVKVRKKFPNCHSITTHNRFFYANNFNKEPIPRKQKPFYQPHTLNNHTH